MQAHSTIAVVGSNVTRNGSISAIRTTGPTPGMAPTMTPITTPMMTVSSICQENAAISPSMLASMAGLRDGRDRRSGSVAGEERAERQLRAEQQAEHEPDGQRHADGDAGKHRNRPSAPEPGQ